MVDPEPLGPPDRPLAKGGVVWTWPAGAGWWRIYHLGTRCPDATTLRFVGPIHRFDHHVVHTGGDRGVMYLAEDLGTAAAEVFGDDGRKGNALVCPASRAAWLAPTEPFPLQDLTGVGSMGIDATNEIGVAALPRSVTQAWARAVYEDDPSGVVAGMRYSTRHDGGLAVVVWERAPRFVVKRDALGDTVDRPLLEPPVWAQLVVELARRRITPKPIGADECARCRAGY